MKPLGKVKIEWSPEFAYAIGLLTTDGNLSKDGRHLNMTSKDKELIVKFKNCLQLNNKIGRKARGGSKTKKYFVIQFGDKIFYNFLLSIGLKPAKSKTLNQLNIPDNYFTDFLRGCIDGDGSIGTFKHPESQYPQLRIRIYSASYPFIYWLKEKIKELLNIKQGWIERGSDVGKLSYGKNDSIKILNSIYYNIKDIIYLKRKYKIAKKFLRA